MAIRQISVFLENKPGMLNKMTDVLAQAGITLRAMSLAETKDFGIVRMIVDDVYETVTVLKDHHYISSMTPVVAVKLADEVGSLNKALTVLTETKENLEYMYSTFSGAEDNAIYLIMRVENTKRAESALRNAGFELGKEPEKDDEDDDK